MGTNGIADLTLAFAEVAPTQYQYRDAKPDHHGPLHVWTIGRLPGGSIMLAAAGAYDPDAEEIERRVAEAKAKLSLK